MPKRTPNDKDEDETIVHAQALKLLRTNTHSVSTEDDIDDEQCDDNDCIILATCPDVITIDSDAEEPAQLSLKIGTDIFGINCDCNSVNCDICIKDSDRRKIIIMYKSSPVIEMDNNKKMVSQIARHLPISQRLIHKVINKYRNMLGSREMARMPDESDSMPAVHMPIFAAPTTAHKLTAMEMCTLRREMLGAKPAHIARTFKHCYMSFKHKLQPEGIFEGLSAYGLWWQRIRHRVKKTCRLIVCEHEDTRIQRIRFIRYVQKYRKEGKPIIYIDELNPLTSDDTRANALIVAAASADGPIASVYMKKLTSRNFLKWITNQIFTKLTESAIIVMRSTSIFRSHRIIPIPDENDSRAQMIAWLQAHRAYYDKDMFKSELFERILMCDQVNDKYSIDIKIREKGHEVMYIPINNADLDPFELIWNTIKLKMMARGVRSFNMNREFMNIDTDIWKEHFDRIVDVETTYIDIERNFDRTVTLYRIEKDAWTDSSNSQDTTC